jgi:hypothetical protein
MYAYLSHILDEAKPVTQFRLRKNSFYGLGIFMAKLSVQSQITSETIPNDLCAFLLDAYNAQKGNFAFKTVPETRLKIGTSRKDDISPPPGGRGIQPTFF